MEYLRSVVALYFHLIDSVLVVTFVQNFEILDRLTTSAVIKTVFILLIYNLILFSFLNFLNKRSFIIFFKTVTLAEELTLSFGYVGYSWSCYCLTDVGLHVHDLPAAFGCFLTEHSALALVWAKKVCYIVCALMRRCKYAWKF